MAEKKKADGSTRILAVDGPAPGERRVSILDVAAALLDPSLSTTVTATIVDVTGAPVTSGQVRFELKPSIATVIQNQNLVEPSITIGSISPAGQLLNQAGTGPVVVARNTVLSPAGTYYEVSIWPQNIKTAVFNWYAISATQDLSASVPLPPVLPSLPYGPGTVQSVGLAAPPEFTVTGSPVTTSGVLTFAKASQNANLVYAGPASGGPAVPSFRAMVNADLPRGLLNRIFVLAGVGTSTYTPTAGSRALYVECIAGGGAGGGAAVSSSNLSCGGGGGAGGYSATWLTGLKASYSYSIGGGGVAVSGATGGNGGDTSLDSPAVCLAKGGAGGTVLAAGTTVVATNGGAGGAASAGLGDLRFDGGDGGAAIRLSPTAAVTGAGAGAPLGGGGTGGTTFTPTVGKQYGGGGNGAATTAAAALGGNGANGVIRIWEFF